MGANAFVGCSSLTIYVQAASRPPGWHTSWNPNNRPVVWGSPARYLVPVTFNINNGTGTAPAQQNAQSGTAIILPDNAGFLRTGFNFTGWNTAANGTGTNFSAGDFFTPTRNTTLFAQWELSSEAQSFSIPIFLFHQYKIGYITGVVGGHVEILCLQTNIFPNHFFDHWYMCLGDILKFGDVPTKLTDYLTLNNTTKTIFCMMMFVGTTFDGWEWLYIADFDIKIGSNGIQLIVRDVNPVWYWWGQMYTAAIWGSSNPSFRASLQSALEQFNRMMTEGMCLQDALQQFKSMQRQR